MKFCIIFVNSIGKEYNLQYTVYNTSIGKRWYNLLKSHLEKNSTVSEPDRLYNFPSSNWNEEKIVNELNECIDVINSNEKIITHTAYLGMPQEQLNHLHHYFEKLRGGVLTPGNFWQSANTEHRKALERYNVIIHRAENFYKQDSIKNPRIVVTFKPKKRVELLDDDYNYFTFARQFGEVYINYCEVGKPLYDVFKDGDDIVGEDNIKPLRYYSPDFTVTFHDRTQEKCDRFIKAMNEWWDQNNNYLTALGFTKNDPKNAMGNIPVASIDTNKQPSDIVYDLCEYNRMERVEVYE